jgi:hypothetical protein
MTFRVSRSPATSNYVLLQTSCPVRSEREVTRYDAAVEDPNGPLSTTSDERGQVPPATYAARAPIDTAWATISLLVPTLIALLAKMGSIDLAYHIRAGEQMLDTHVLIRQDTWLFSLPAGTSWTDQQWGAQLIFATLYRTGGWVSLAAAWAFLSGLSVWFVYLACRSRGASPRGAALLTVGGYLIAQPTLGMRPQLLALPLFTMCVWALASRREHPRRVWLLPVAAAVAANLHGSFALFPLLGGLAWIEDVARKDPQTRRMLIITAITAVATLLNPFGFQAWVYVVDLSTNPIIRKTITEWEPTSINGIAGWAVFGSLALLIAYFARRREAIAWTDLLTLAVFLYLALSAQRAIVWWGLVVPVVVAGLLRPAKARPEAAESPVPAFTIIGVLALAILVLLPWWRSPTTQQLVGETPPGIAQAVGELPAGARVFAHQPWGSWLELTDPNQLYLVDSRIEIIPKDVWEDYDQVAFSRAAWHEALEKWDVQAIVAKKKDWDPILPFLRDDPDWKIAHEDDDGVVFVRA